MFAYSRTTDLSRVWADSLENEYRPKLAFISPAGDEIIKKVHAIEEDANAHGYRACDKLRDTPGDELGLAEGRQARGEHKCTVRPYERHLTLCLDGQISTYLRNECGGA
jgi:hypothetical protein